MAFFKHQYYDSPEGQDVWKKTLVTSRFAAITGLGCASFDVMMYSHPQGVANTLGRFAWYIGPLVGMATAFTVTANVSRNVRGRDDLLNYFLGGIASGGVYGAWQKSIPWGFTAAAVLGVAAVVKKLSIEEGWLFFPEPRHAAHNATSVRHDWTLMKELGTKGFTTGSM